MGTTASSTIRSRFRTCSASSRLAAHGVIGAFGGARPSTVSSYKVSFPYAKLDVRWLRWSGRPKLSNIQPHEY